MQNIPPNTNYLKCLNLFPVRPVEKKIVFESVFSGSKAKGILASEPRHFLKKVAGNIYSLITFDLVTVICLARTIGKMIDSVNDFHGPVSVLTSLDMQLHI